ncbi:MAG: hypothetical protein VXX74_01700 [Actinomycetota bacterium]|nr:hypothetical protein [Actinomycetota bacterium]
MVRIVVAMKVTVTATLAGERWAVPHMPWPEVQPPATAAPQPNSLAPPNTREVVAHNGNTSRMASNPDRISAPSRNT